MSFPEASLRWNKERTYVTQQYTKYRHKFLEGSTAVVGYGKKKTFVITRVGMEYLMKQTEKEANEKLWRVRKISDWTTISFDAKVDSEQEARDLITKLILAELRDSNYIPDFEQVQKSPIKYRVVLPNNALFTYEKLKSNDR